MSTTYTAHAVIGTRLTRAEFVRKVREKTFDHDFPEDWTHDPKTGRELWAEAELCAFQGDDDESGEDFECFLSDHWNPRQATLRAVVEPYEDGDIVIGLECRKLDWDGYSDNHPFRPLYTGSVEAVRDDLTALLSPLGLWFPERFGLYAVLDAG